MSFLELVIDSMKETKQPRLKQPLLYLKLQIARTKLQSGDLPSCASIIDEGKDELDALSDVSSCPSFSSKTHTAPPHCSTLGEAVKQLESFNK